MQIVVNIFLPAIDLPAASQQAVDSKLSKSEQAAVKAAFRRMNDEHVRAIELHQLMQRPAGGA